MLTREQFQLIFERGADAVFAHIDKLQQQMVTLEQLALSTQQQIELLSQQVKELQARLNKNSRNSNLPPSSDGLSKKTSSQRQKSGRKSGGQKGHPGRTLEFVNDPDQTFTYAPTHCDCCGASLSSASVIFTERRQVWELPVLAMSVIEHQVQTRLCAHCGNESSAEFPAMLKGPVSYGSGVKAFVSYLSHFQLLPLARVAALMEDLLGVSISEGTLYRITRQAHERLCEVEAGIHHALETARQAHFDETGVRIGGKLYWQHVSSNELLTYYACHKKRGRAALEDIGILPSFGGRAIHDGWSAYSHFDCQHALCNAHHLRELTGLEEHKDQPWATQMKELLLAIKEAVDQAKQKGKHRLNPWRLACFEARYDRLLKAGYQENPEPASTGTRGRPKQGRARSLLLRLDGNKDEVLAFIHDFCVPFDNNLAERDIRMMKVKQKVSGCFRSQQGAEAFCRIRGYISTMRKQRHNVLDVLQSVFDGAPIMPALT